MGVGVGGCACSFLLQDNPLSVPKRPLAESEADSMQLKYYSTEMHTASFVLPSFLKKVSSSQCLHKLYMQYKQGAFLHTQAVLALYPF